MLQLQINNRVALSFCNRPSFYSGVTGKEITIAVGLVVILARGKVACVDIQIIYFAAGKHEARYRGGGMA